MEAVIIVAATEASGAKHSVPRWERRTPVRPGLAVSCSTGGVCEVSPHWGAALPDGLEVDLNAGTAGKMIKAEQSVVFARRTR
ncbi:hypothetical protein [uncultured Thiodictyon sp.]|uniref:hypothetical protein n=1 Tax=uncultured Thiodictyon sp. TaxID=1846217 RepID=UPI0025F10EF5|nr:hypothetical protein [uncultured Thiodictyon sp.]